jgi:hypothetical protein
MTDQQFQQVYPGWGRTEAEADAAAHPEKLGGSGSSGGSSVDSILQAAISPITAMINAQKDYEKANPFAFDEQLAREASTQEYSPYYDELLSDYTSEVQRTSSRSDEDMKTTLEQLAASKDYYVGRERRLLDKATRNTNEGYAGNNLFFSGARERDVKELSTEYMAGIGTEEQPGQYLKEYQQNVTGTKLANTRTQEDLATKQSNYTRDTTREKQYNIEQGILTRKQEYTDEYENARKNYYSDWYLGGMA